MRGQLSLARGAGVLALASAAGALAPGVVMFVVLAVPPAISDDPRAGSFAGAVLAAVLVTLISSVIVAGGLVAAEALWLASWKATFALRLVLVGVGAAVASLLVARFAFPELVRATPIYVVVLAAILIGLILALPLLVADRRNAARDARASEVN